MKKILCKKVLFIIFFILILLLNLILPQTLNYDNILTQERYEQALESEITPEISEEDMLKNKSKIDNFDSFLKEIRILMCIVSIAFCIIFIIFDMSKISLEKIFLIICIPIGLLYIFIIPIGGVPDEQPHWFRAYEVSLGHMFSDKDEENYGGRVLPNVIKDAIKDDHITIPRTEAEEEFTEFSNTSLYSAVCYFPQAFGIIVGRIFSASVEVQAHLARIFNFLLYVIVMFYAIRKIPFKKLALMIIAFLPITFQEVSSLAIDGMQIAFSSLLISYTLYLTFDESKQKLNLKDFIILLVSGIFTAITKFIYLPLCLIIYIIPKEKFKNIKIKYILLTSFLLIMTILDVLLMVNSLNYNNRISLQGADAIEQLKFILKNPIEFLEVLVLTIQSFAMENMLELFGKRLLWLDVDISPIYIISLIIITMYFLYFEKSNNDDKVENDNLEIQNKSLIITKYRMNLITRCFMTIITLGTTFGIVFTEYLTINSVKDEYVIGIQGRYYIPILIFFGITFTKNLNTKNKISKIEYLLIFMIFANLNALINIMFYYL